MMSDVLLYLLRASSVPSVPEAAPHVEQDVVHFAEYTPGSTRELIGEAYLLYLFILSVLYYRKKYTFDKGIENKRVQTMKQLLDIALLFVRGDWLT